MRQDAQSRAARLQAASHIVLENVGVRPPQPGEARVRLEGCGVCGSNLPVWEGRPWFTYPLEPGSPGHEGWGVIEEIGAQLQGFAVGDRVALLSAHAYAEHDYAGAEALVRLPPQLAGQPFPGEPLACAVNIFRRSEIQAGQSVAIVGVGFLGAVLTQLCVRAGARVVALSRRPFALRTAEQLGANATIGLADNGQALHRARQLAPQDGYERVIECVGSQEALDIGSELVGTRGRFVIAGYHQDGDRRINLQAWNWRGIDVINAHERDPARYRQGIEAAIDLVVSGEIAPGRLFTHQFPLQDIGAAFDLLARRPAGFLKGLVMCS